MHNFTNELVITRADDHNNSMRIFLTVFAFLFILPACSTANEQPYEQWLQEFKAEAKSLGISDKTLEFMDGTEPDERVVELDRKQPESTKTSTQYMEGMLPASRINQGRELLAKHDALLSRIEQKYGVQKRFIVALWGMETNYGGYTGNFSTINALATLAYDGRRSDFFRSELIKALQIVDAGHISAYEMEGSWAGAMGQSQFMPSSFLAYAVDENGDGHKDIWGTTEDVFGSIASYLSQSGWDDDLTWGRAVSIPEGIDLTLEDNKTYLPLSQWQAMGVRKMGGADLPEAELEARLVLPGETYEQAYLVYKNYDVLMKWNRSNYFGTSVGTLSDKIGY